MKHIRVALVGYGKMGRAIESLASHNQLQIVERISQSNAEQLLSLERANVDLAIEFTNPSSCIETIPQLIAKQIPIVIGTTGWMHRLEEFRQLAQAKGTPCVYGSNYSIGVQLLYKLNRMLAKWMNDHTQYDPYIEERHHAQKKDAPSGTALHLANDILAALDRKQKNADYAELMHRPPAPDELSIAYTRSGNFTGTHIVGYASDVDRLEIRHEAISREGFAAGAIYAAKRVRELAPGLHDFSTLI